jgi:hypothetical protein
MKRRIATTLAGIALALAGFAAAPSPPGGPAPSPLAALAGAQGAVTKSLSAAEGGGNVGGSGSRFADLLSGVAVPIVIVVAGILLIGSLAARNIGASVGIVVITLFGLIFLLSPSAIESTAKAVANIVF